LSATWSSATTPGFVAGMEIWDCCVIGAWLGRYVVDPLGFDRGRKPARVLGHKGELKDEAAAREAPLRLMPKSPQKRREQPR
jgi:hypothetical protein